MNVTRAAVAGLVGTAAMTALLLVEPSVGLPKIAMGQVLSTSLGLTTARLSIGPALGWGPAVVRGMLYGALVFVVAQIVFMPLVGGGVFSRGDVELLAGSLLGHLLYGGVIGWTYGGPGGST
jgi:hypothetical protein